MIKASALGAGDLGLIPYRVIPTTLEMVVMASLLGTQGYGDNLAADSSVPGKNKMDRKGISLRKCGEFYHILNMHFLRIKH